MLEQALDTAIRHHQAGNLPQAEQLYRQILQLDPYHVDALHLLGVLSHQVGRHDLAVGYIAQAIARNPSQAPFHSNLGAAYQALGRLDEAVASYQQALRLNPDYAEGHHNLGVALMEQGKLDEAVASYQQALRLNPNYVKAHHNLAAALHQLGRLDEALASYEQVLARDPRQADAHFNRSLIWLLRGEWERGWPEYEWRWQRTGGVPRSFRQPLWDGSPLEGKTILLHGEQGLGDTLHFIRYAPLVKERGGTVLVECPGALVPLLSRCAGVDRLLARGAALPDFEVQAALLSLPGILGTTVATVPANVPYLSADAELLDRWQRELGRYPGFRIGLAWHGNPRHRAAERDILLRQFAPLARLPGVRLFSLQKGPGSEQLRDLPEGLSVVDFGDRLDESSGAFMDTAAIMKHLDLVVTSDTAVAHLAGGLGVPVWVGLPRVAEWRWLLDREDSPWYPTMRLFRQTRRGDWSDVLERIAREAEKLLDQPAPGEPILVEVAPGELIDKITILEIKSERITEAAALEHVRAELAVLRAAHEEALEPSEALRALTAELKAVNTTLWEIEDEIRLCEARGDFGPRFVELARSVYQQNDRRAALKRQVNELLGSELMEEKVFTADEPPG
jgi:Flp pilus assembly protein TadD